MYRQIIDDVIDSIKVDFDEYGMEEDVLINLQAVLLFASDSVKIIADADLCRNGKQNCWKPESQILLEHLEHRALPTLETSTQLADMQLL